MRYAFTKDFDGNSAFELALSWAMQHSVSADGGRTACAEAVVVFTVPAYKNQIDALLAADTSHTHSGVRPDIVCRNSWTNADVASEIAAACARFKADYAVYAWADCPFLNASLTKELLSLHTTYKAEYTFADGFAYGLAPEVIDKGAAGIIATLGKESQKTAGSKPAGRDALFAIMSGDINSFEIETHIADKDYRMLRLSFDCGSKATALGCTRLYAALKDSALGAQDGADAPFVPQSVAFVDEYALSDLAASRADVLQTLPAFYNVQIASRYKHQYVYSPYPLLCAAREKQGCEALSDMPFERFSALVAAIASTSENAVVSLSLYGEPLLHPRFVDCVAEVLRYPQLSVFIETDGTLVTESLAERLAALGGGSSADARIMWCVLLDAADAPLYAYMHGISDAAAAASDFAAAHEAVALLSRYFPHNVYPQLTRMKANESQLEAFYRYWKKNDGPSLGELIIQKYDHCCKSLPDEKSADLSPVERFPCWHLRRDLCVLADGSVLPCRSALTATPVGNVFDESIETVWSRFSPAVQKQIEGVYDGVSGEPNACKVCDEYYTFNF